MPTTTGYINLSVNGNEARELEASIHYEYDAPTGDGWYEPRYPSRVVLCSVECKGIDFLPLLDKQCISNIEAELLGDHEEAMKPDPDHLRDMREEWV
jgi:hypothetical protein